MTTTLKSMEETIALLHQQQPDCKIMVGGAVLTPAGMDFSRRLEIIYDELLALIDRAKPDALAVEKLPKYVRRELAEQPAES